LLNPDKGYIVTANNRILPETSAVDFGASMTQTTRAKRIEEVLKEHISAGHKMTFNDMRALQEDTIDIWARDYTPKLLKIAERYSTSELESQKFRSMKELLDGWDGEISLQSKQATALTYVLFYWQKSMLHKFYTLEDSRLKLTDNTAFIDFQSRLIHSLFDDTVTDT
jgi:penicillin amidase